MAHAHHPSFGQSQTRLGDLAPRLLIPGVALGILGLGAGILLGYLPEAHRPHFFHAWLLSFVYYLSITLGALFFVMLHHLTRAGWSVTVRRLAEALANNFWLLLLLFLPLLGGLNELYEWLAPGVVAHDPILAGKSFLLNRSALIGWMIVCFVVWIGLAWYFRSRSIRQDRTGDPVTSRRMEMVAAPGMFLLAGTLTLASVYLLMALNPHWYSTIFGVYIFAGSVLSFLVLLTLMALWLQRSDRLAGVITTEHYHDLGKLTFAFTVFWGYIAFSQYMLIWYANIPEETQFYIPRQIGPWAAVSILLLLSNLLIPFLGLMSRHAKRRLALFTFWAVWLLLAHLLDLFWIIMPNLYINKIPAVVGEPHMLLPEALQRLVVSNHSIYTLDPKYSGFFSQIIAPLEPRQLLVTFCLFLGMGGLYLASTTLLLKSAPLVPLKDPRLSESLAFENA